MAAFGDDFDLSLFKSAYETSNDMDAYNRVQTVERALCRVQNYVGDLTIAAVKLAGLELPRETHTSPTVQALTAMLNAGVISPPLLRTLTRAQEGRTRIEHSYVTVPAGDAHRAAMTVRASSREFIAAFRLWIEPILLQSDTKAPYR